MTIWVTELQITGLQILPKLMSQYGIASVRPNIHFVYLYIIFILYRLLLYITYYFILLFCIAFYTCLSKGSK